MYYLILCAWMFCPHVCLCTMSEWCSRRTEEGTGIPGTIVTGDMTASTALNYCAISVNPKFIIHTILLGKYGHFTLTCMVHP